MVSIYSAYTHGDSTRSGQATFHKVAVCSIFIYLWIQSLNMASKSVKISGWNMQSDSLNIKYIDQHQTGTHHMLYDITILYLVILTLLKMYNWNIPMPSPFSDI